MLDQTVEKFKEDPRGGKKVVSSPDKSTQVQTGPSGTTSCQKSVFWFETGVGLYQYSLSSRKQLSFIGLKEDLFIRMVFSSDYTRLYLHTRTEDPHKFHQREIKIREEGDLLRDSGRNTYVNQKLPCENWLTGLEISSDDKFLFTITYSGLYEMRSLDPHECVVRIQVLCGGKIFGVKSFGDKFALTCVRNGDLCQKIVSRDTAKVLKECLIPDELARCYGMDYCLEFAEDLCSSTFDNYDEPGSLWVDSEGNLCICPGLPHGLADQSFIRTEDFMIADNNFHGKIYFSKVRGKKIVGFISYPDSWGSSGGSEAFASYLRISPGGKLLFVLYRRDEQYNLFTYCIRTRKKLSETKFVSKPNHGRISSRFGGQWEILFERFNI